MGLDMYLYIEKYESCCEWDNPETYQERKKDFYPEELKPFVKNIETKCFLSKNTRYMVGYWRKANAIHNWFVENCANGEDDCRPVYVGFEKLQELLKICKKVLEKHELASELLPTQSGFFFGSTDYDEWYYKDIEDTIKQLEPVVKFIEENDTKQGIYYSVIYEASW